jgi:hypothetical protein
LSAFPLPLAEALVEILEARTGEWNNAMLADAMAGATPVTTRQQGRQQMSMTSSETRRTGVDQASTDARPIAATGHNPGPTPAWLTEHAPDRR